DDNIKTPLDEQFDKLGRLITRFAYAVAVAIVIGRVIMYVTSTPFEWMSFMAYLLQTFMIAVTLVVVSVPEGLPMAVTLALAYSMRRMLKTNNLVRKLHACETMGATTVICTDKTGTLTQNQMRVSAMNISDTIPHDLLVEGIAANSTAELDLSGEKPSVIGNPTEGALLLWLRDQEADYRKIRDSLTTIDELPFTTERKYMATAVINASGRRMLYVKGAPEIVFGMSGDSCGTSRAEIDRELLEFQNQGMRTLGFAYKRLDDGEDPVKDGKIVAKGLTFMGIAAISDPIRPDVADAVKDVNDAGIDVKIVTGDTPATAREIGRQIGIWTDADSDEAIITGQEFEALDDEQLLQRGDGLKIIARARPMDKKRLVEAVQNKGEVVAVTGDGTN
ncbi:MAG: HAD-IC family P-type ATPase, partial [Paramuribaculum sp.]|nr:HAD-IC family P-type ATPase [Paramuribaculum sp.]